jgi:O-6-methylguanine DNA methyltransferase
MDQKSDDSISRRLIKTPIGLMELLYRFNTVHSLCFIQESSITTESEPDLFSDNVTEQLDNYFQGKLRKFDLNIELNGTDFQNKVWKELQSLPYGKTISYSELAKKVGNESHTRAVATSNARNKILILIPCHRVIGKDGKLTGYSGGLDRKRWLLNHEFQDVQDKLLLF